ncbi:Hypothetical protein NTJ_01534 [Nesidiocoris tenuis]|uniref:Odorant receptor n=1 Tax=Nesidiocoris tenuis TaxID=355587 RepID=A0ABN7ABW1_9HEMI|nr:Hypothetical protein NTJ_01534 [Nesidiocoris tenuis]
MLRRWKEEEESRTLLTRMGLKFLFGLSVYIGPWVLRFPINVPPFFYILAGFGMVVKIILHYDNVALVIDCSHMVIHVIVGLQTYHIAKNKHKVLRLASFLDCFTRYSDQTSKGGEIKNECESHVLTLYAIFSRCILVTINIYILFPVYKLFTADGRANLSKVLVWPMWMGVPETSWWGFSILFTIELVTSMFLLLSVMYTVPYLASVGKMAAGQCELLCHSIRSMEMRVKKVTDNPQMQITFEQALNYELDEASRRLQLLKR